MFNFSTLMITKQIPRLSLVFGVLIVVSLCGCASLLAPKVESEIINLKAGQYTLDKSHTTVLFKIKHMGLSTYVGRFNKFDGSLDFDPLNITNTELNAVIDIGSLDVNNEDLKDDLMGRRWFVQRKYPQAIFSTTSIKTISETELEFVGNLDWRGVVKPISLTVIFHGGANNILTGKYTIGFSAKGSFLRSDFGMDSYIPVVADKVELEIYAEFQRD